MPPPGYEPFLESVLADPYDDAPRLVYADWLEEQGDARGLFIRIQVELTQLPPRDPQADRLRDYESNLLVDHGDKWRLEIPEWARNGCEFRRGFVEEVTIWRPWESRFGRLLAHDSPIFKLKLQVAADCLGHFLRGPNLPHYNALTILDSRFTITDLRELCKAAPPLEPLQRLMFHAQPLGDTGLLVISLCPHLNRLEQLRLARCRVEHRGLERLSTSTKLPSLIDLDLSDNDLTEDCCYLLASSPLASRLQRLNLSRNGLNFDCLRAMVQSPGFANLVYVDLSHNLLDDRAVPILCEHFCGLARIELNANRFSNGAFLDLRQEFGTRVRIA